MRRRAFYRCAWCGDRALKFLRLAVKAPTAARLRNLTGIEFDPYRAWCGRCSRATVREITREVPQAEYEAARAVAVLGESA